MPVLGELVDLVSCQLLYDQKTHLMVPILDRSVQWDTNNTLSATGFLVRTARIHSLHFGK